MSVRQPSFGTKVLLTGGTFVVTYAGTVTVVPAALGRTKRLYTSLKLRLYIYVNVVANIL